MNANHTACSRVQDTKMIILHIKLQAVPHSVLIAVTARVILSLIFYPNKQKVHRRDATCLQAKSIHHPMRVSICATCT